MLTIFASPKPFTDPAINIAQRNAIQSWTRVRPACDIILFGNDFGTAQVASEYGIRHIPDVACNSEGLPLVKDLFERAQGISRFAIMAYINSDIILLSDFTSSVNTVQDQLSGKHFLVIGQRYNLEVPDEINFNDKSWEEDLRRRILVSGELRGTGAIDYFVFTRGLWSDIPPMVIGRVAFDNWLIYKARSLGVDVIDATKAITVVHQQHTYAKDHLYRRRQSPEALKQRSFLGGDEYLFRISDANLLLDQQGLRRQGFTITKLKRLLQVGPAIYPRFAFLFRFLHRILSGLKNLFISLKKQKL